MSAKAYKSSKYTTISRKTTHRMPLCMPNCYFYISPNYIDSLARKRSKSSGVSIPTVSADTLHTLMR